MIETPVMDWACGKELYRPVVADIGISVGASVSRVDDCWAEMVSPYHTHESGPGFMTTTGFKQVVLNN